MTKELGLFMTTGKFISLEGGEGAGKSTQAKLLADSLRGSGLEVIATREPGGTPGAEAVRALLVTGKADRWDALSELYLLNAARRDHVERLIRPALARGAWVITDRYVDSTRVYQGVAKGLADETVLRYHKESTGDLWPDLTLILDIKPEVGIARTQQRSGSEARFESESLEFHQALREGFLVISEQEPVRVDVIDASQSVEQMAVAIRASVRTHLGA
jgi:dTMP kinase